MDVREPDAGEGKMLPQTGVRACYQYWFLVGAAVVFLIWAWATSWLSPIIEPDINQHRRNTALPPPQETSQIRQTFTPNRDGLAEVEVKLARESQNDTGGRFELQLLDQSGQTISAVSLESSDLVHEQVYVLKFAPQPDSDGQTYTLLASGTANNDVSLWGYDLDVHSGGQLTLLGGNTAVQDLYLISRYQLTLPVAIQSLWQTTTSQTPFLFLALAYILMPGFLVLGIWQTILKKKPLSGVDWFTRTGIALALGLSSWPILWQFLSLIGLHWSGSLLWIVLITGWLITITLNVKHHSAFVARFGKSIRDLPNRATNDKSTQLPNYELRITNYALILILLAAFATRFLAIRDQTFPLWVDATRHGLITAVMAESGQVIQDYQPYLPIDRFPYHYGFHTISAGLTQMTEMSVSDLLLNLGQLLNVLVPLSLYAAGYLFTRRRLVGLTAAFLVALPFFFPGYYATWGRMTQLIGVLVLPVLLALTWNLVRGAKWWRSAWWLVALLAAGLFLIHFRVFLLYIVYAGVVWLFSLGRNGRRLILTALLALLLVAPRISRLLGDTNPARAISNNLTNYNDFPTGYVTVGWERSFLYIGAFALFLALIGVIFRRKWAYGPLFLVVWAGVTAVLLSGSRLGLPETSLININSAYIVLFVPLALLIGMVGERLWRWLMRRNWLLQAAGAMIVGVGIAAASLFGLNQQIAILNPETILAWPPDSAGLQWLDENAPDDAKFAVNAFSWLGTTWAGRDGGAWIVPSTGRDSTTPPADYIYNPDLALSVAEFNEMANSWGNWADPLVTAQLRDSGISHIFIGAKGGFIDPAELAKNPEMEMLYGQDGVFIFQLTGVE